MTASRGSRATTEHDRSDHGRRCAAEVRRGQRSRRRWPADGIAAFSGRLIVEEPSVEPFHGGSSDAVGTTEVDADPLPADRFSNRELSWLDFNARVLALAEDTGQPLLERAKFLAIFASNLDEFYMVRVAGLKRRREMGLSVTSADGLTAGEQLALISARTQELVDRQGRCFTDDVLPALAEAGIRIVHWEPIDPRGPGAAGRVLHRADLPGAHPAGRRPGAPVPVHLRPQPEHGDHRARPGDRGRAVRPGEGAEQRRPVRPGAPRRSTTSCRWRT